MLTNGLRKRSATNFLSFEKVTRIDEDVTETTSTSCYSTI